MIIFLEMFDVIFFVSGVKVQTVRGRSWVERVMSFCRRTSLGGATLSPSKVSSNYQR